MADHQMFQEVKGELLQELRSMLMQHNAGRMDGGSSAEEPDLTAENTPVPEGEEDMEASPASCPDCGAGMDVICPECGYSEGGAPEEEAPPPQVGPRSTKSARLQPPDEE